MDIENRTALGINSNNLHFSFLFIQCSYAFPELRPLCSRRVIKLKPLNCLKLVSIAGFYIFKWHANAIKQCDY
jgi:hypothetical protein